MLSSTYNIFGLTSEKAQFSCSVNRDGRSLGRVLDPNQTLHTLVLVLHNEVINQHLDMAYFEGIFNDEKVNIRTLDYIPEYLYPMKATLDLVGFWKMRGFSRFLVVHLVLLCISQCSRR